MEPTSSKELAAALSQSLLEPSPVSQPGRLTPKQARVAAQAGGQVGSKMDNISDHWHGVKLPPASIAGKTRTLTRKLEEPCANKLKVKAELWQ